MVLFALEKRLTVNNEFKPQTTSFSLRVGAQPNPSKELCLSRLKQTAPFSLILGCHNLVSQCTSGGCKQKINKNQFTYNGLLNHKNKPN